ncbi:MAG: Nif3-like dinuclear metal center hexameric protein [Clostridia bacterium]|nr:Nif3-like dinuclear metal center hexameric protein [Clostridia bacterium]
MAATVGQMLAVVDGIAPFETAEPWDNVGLLAGDPSAPVDTVLCALDLRMEVLEEAVRNGAQLIVTHHPILFRGRKNLCETDAEGRLLCALVRSGIAMIAAHTNYDNASPGVNDALAKALALNDVEALDSGMRVGSIKETDFGMFCDFASGVLGGPVRVYGDRNRRVRRVAVLGGAGEDYVSIARQGGADVYLTGEMAYHKALAAADEGVCVVEAGHAATEYPAISQLSDALQNAANALQYDIRVLKSKAELFF